MCFGSGGSQTTEQEQEPAARTPEQQWISNQVMKLFQGSDAQPQRSAYTPMYMLGGGSWPYPMPSMAMPQTTGETTYVPSLQKRIEEDVAHVTEADKAALDAIIGAGQKFLELQKGAGEEWREGLSPIQDWYTGKVAENDAAALENAKIANRAVTPMDAITLSLGDFRTPFYTGSERGRWDREQRAKESAQDYGLRLTDQSTGLQNESANILNQILSQKQQYNAQQLGVEEKISQMQKAFAGEHTPNEALNKLMAILLEQSRVEDQLRYGIPSITSTTTTQEKPGFLDILSGLTSIGFLKF